MKNHLFPSALLALALTLVSCGGNDTPAPEPPKTVAVQSVSLDKSSLTLTVGDQTTLAATVLPANASNTNVTWSSIAPAIASVSYNGVVTALDPGSTEIIVTTQDGNKTASCSVTVNPTKVAVTGVTLNKREMTLEVGTSELLIASVIPTNATDQSIEWSTSNAAVATVNGGSVAGISVGKAIITVTTNDGNKTATATVDVVAPKPTITPDGFVRHLIKSDRPNTYNIVYLSEGYKDTEYSMYDDMLEVSVKALFEIEPFKSYKDYFNVYSVFAVSKDSGITADVETYHYADLSLLSYHYKADTAFGMHWSVSAAPNSGNNSFGMTFPNWFESKVLDYGKKATNRVNHFAFIINGLFQYKPDNAKNELGHFFGFANWLYNYGNLPICYNMGYTQGGQRDSFGKMSTHEIGHGFGLGDEYVESRYEISPDSLQAYASRWYNIDITNDPSKVKWSHFIGRQGYENVGIFEGAHYGKNIYRPTENSLMRDQYMSNPFRTFNAPSREGIVRELFKVVGETFTLDKFFEKDVPNGY